MQYVEDAFNIINKNVPGYDRDQATFVNIELCKEIHKGNTKLLLSYKRMVGESPIPKQARKELFLIKNDSSVEISQEI